MHKEEIIIRILGRALDVFAQDQVAYLREVLDEELYNFELQAISTALVPYNGIEEKLMLYLTAKKLDGLSLKSLKSYAYHLSRFSRQVKKDVVDITTIDIRMFLANYSKFLKKSSMATEINILRSFFTWLRVEEYILKSPMDKIKTTKKEKRIRKALTPAELEMLRDACKTVREKALMEFFYSTACRLDEVNKLNKDNIDWQNDKLIVIGKGDKERFVYLNARAKIHLWKYLESRTDTNEALFVSTRKPYKRLGHRAFQTIFNELGKRAGITKSVHPHLMRHTTATMAINSGASLQEVQLMLGHEDPSVTQIYAVLNTNDIQTSHRKHVS